MSKKIILPVVVRKIINRLEKAGFEAYAVGGCVRDSIMNRTPNDWDICTSAVPSEIKKVFPKTIDTGIEHGTVTVLMGGEDTICDGEKPYELTTYRIDGNYIDGRHPEHVEFTPSLHEDMARRDFTINAMAYNEISGLVDDFGGIEDIKRGLIRAVGDPYKRFSEDALRMLRALRFSAELGFDIEDRTFEAIRDLGENLKNVSKERILVELTKLIMSNNPGKIHRVFDLELDKYICKEFSLIGENIDKTNLIPPVLPKKAYIRWGVLLRNSYENANDIFRSLKMDNDTRKKATLIAELFNKDIPKNHYEVRKWLSILGEELFFDFFKAAVCFGIKDDITKAVIIGKSIVDNGDCISLKDLKVQGRDLIEQGMSPGPEIGIVLNEMFEDVLENPKHNDMHYLISQYVLPRTQNK